MKKLLAQWPWCLSAGNAAQECALGCGRAISQGKEGQLAQHILWRLIETMSKRQPKSWVLGCIGMGQRCSECTFAHAGQTANGCPPFTFEPLCQTFCWFCTLYKAGRKRGKLFERADLILSPFDLIID